MIWPVELVIEGLSLHAVAIILHVSASDTVIN